MKKNIFLILVLGLILRFVVINQSFWLDEAIGALVVKNQTFWQILTEFPKYDFHPPLYYLTLKLWSSLFGYSEIALRTPSVLFGIGTLYLVYKIGKIFNERVGLIASILLATSQFHIYYSQEARMYSMAAFLAALAFYFFIKENWKYFSLATFGLVFTDYMPVFLLPVFWLIGVVSKKSKDWWKKLALSHLPLIILGILWLPIFLAQSQGGKLLLEALPAWAKIAGGATPKQVGLVWAKFVLGRISFFNKAFYYLSLLIVSLPFGFLLIKAWSRRKKLVPILLWFIVPLILGFLVSILFPAFTYFRFLFVIPAFYLLLAWGSIHVHPTTRTILVVLLLSVNIFTWLLYVFDENQKREAWRQAVGFVESRAKQEEMVVFNSTEPFAPYQWYEKGKVKAMGLTDSVAANPLKTKEKTVSSVVDIKGVYYFEYLWELHDPLRVVESSLKEAGFLEVYAFDFPGVGIVRYLKRI